MAGVALRSRRPDLVVDTAGTLSVDGLPMSWRTREALRSVGLRPDPHASRQAVAGDVDRSDLVIGLAPEHVAWVRREHPSAAARSATLRRLVRDLSPAPMELDRRLAGLRLADLPLEAWEEIADPGGGELEAFVDAARTIDALVERLADLV